MRQRVFSFRNIPYFWLFVLGALWGANFPFMKVAGQTLPARQIVWLRLAFGTLALAPFLPGAIRGVLRSPWLMAHSCVMSLAANVVTFHCFMEGTHRLDSGMAGVLSGTIPLMTALLAWAFLPEEKPDPGKILGLLLGFGGIAAVMAPWKGVGGDILAGAAYMLAGSLGYGVAFVYARRFLSGPTLAPLGLAALQMLAATIMYAPLAGFEGMGRIFHEPGALLVVAVGLGALGSGAAYVVYYGLIQVVGAVAASSVTYLPPLVAMALGAVFLGEPVGPRQFAGAALVLSGIFLLRRGGK